MTYPINGSNPISAIPDANIDATQSKTTLDKIPPKEIAKVEQSSRPEKSGPSNLEFAKKALGITLIGVGFTAGVALAPITVPFGLLGAGIGLGVGKGLEKLNNAISGESKKTDAGFIGSAVGAAIGSLLIRRL